MRTSDGLGPALNIITWIAMIIMVLSVTAKLSSKLVKNSKLMLDDLLLTLAMILAIGQSVAVNEQVSAGLGRTTRPQTPEEMVQFQKAKYASDLLYILTLTFSKLPTWWLINVLAPVTSIRATVIGGLAITGAWTTIGLLGSAFQCPLPDAWEVLSPKCINQVSFWDFIGVVDILLDLVLVAAPVQILVKLQIPRTPKSAVMAAFAARLVVIPLTILRLAFISAGDTVLKPPRHGFASAVSTELQMHVAIVAACIPFLKTVIDSMQTGSFASDLIRAPFAVYSTPSPKHTFNLSQFRRSDPQRHASDSSTHRLQKVGGDGGSNAAAATVDTLERGEMPHQLTDNGILVRTTISTEAEPKRSFS